MTTTGRTTTIRAARPADLPALLRLFDALEEDQGAHRVFPPVPDLYAWAARTFETAIDDPDREVLVADEGGGLVAMAIASIHEPGQHASHTTRLVDISKVVVLPGWRAQGIATDLVRAAEAFGRARGAEYVVAKVYSGNAGGLRFWERIGFAARYEERVRRIEAASSVDGPASA